MKSLPASKKINVLLVTNIYPDSTAKHVGTFVANWAEQLAATGFNVLVYKRDHITFGSYLKSFARIVKYYRSPRVFNYDWNGISVCRQGIHLRLPLDYSKSAPKVTYRKIKPVIADIYKKFPFDIIYLATWGDLSLSMSWIAKEMNIPYISSAVGDHTTLSFDKPDSLYYKLERETYLGSEFVICVSKDMNKKVKFMTEGKARTTTFYSGVDTEKFQPFAELRNEFRRRLDYAVKDFMILFVGRITKEKGVFELIDAFAQFSKNDPSLKLLLVGALFEKSRLNKAIDQFGIKNRVTLINGAGHDEIPGYMNAADAFVLPSWMEGLPNVVMEACACELPVIASEVGGIPEIIENNVTGFLVPPRSPEDIVKKFEFVFANPEIANNVAHKARQKILREFNYHKNGKILSCQIQNICMRFKKEIAGLGIHHFEKIAGVSDNN
jgi:glycosyltransferase involved in cell wall biosynthesis